MVRVLGTELQVHLAPFPWGTLGKRARSACSFVPNTRTTEEDYEDPLWMASATLASLDD